MSEPKYPPPPGFPPPNNGGGFPPPSDYTQPGGFPPPSNPQSGSYPPPPGYGQPGNYPPPNYGQPGSYPPPPGYNPPGGYSSPGGYQTPGDFIPPAYGYGPQQQVYANPYNYLGGATRANFGVRLVALILDGIIAGIGWGILQTILPASVATAVGWSIIYALYAVLTSLYFDGATIGKMLLGIRVVDEYGNVPDLFRLILRYSIGYWISWFICGFGFLWAAWDGQSQAIHDKIARTYVVTKNRQTRY